MKNSHETQSTLSKTSINPRHSSPRDEKVKGHGTQFFSDTPIRQGKWDSGGGQFTTPQTWRNLMTGFDTPIMLPSEKRTRPRRFLALAGLVSVVFLLGTVFPRSLSPVGISNIHDYFTASHVAGPEIRSVEEAKPLKDNDILVRTSDVQFDNYSLILRGQRIFLQYVITLRGIYSTINKHITALESSIPSVFRFRHCGLIFWKRLKRPG